MRFTASVKCKGDSWTGWINEVPTIKGAAPSRQELEEALRTKLADALAIEASKLGPVHFTVV